MCTLERAIFLFFNGKLSLFAVKSVLNNEYTLWGKYKIVHLNYRDLCSNQSSFGTLYTLNLFGNPD
jgi:hypothetical protein